MRLLLTGFADLEAVVAAVNSGGIYAYVTKPWDVNDLTLRIKQAYEIHQLRSEKDRLLHSYRQIFDTSGDPIVIVDHKGQVLEANAACSKLLGIPVKELLENGFNGHIENSKELVRSFRSRRTGTEFVNVDLTLRTTSGSVIDCLMTATYLGKYANGGRVFQAVIKNITDRKQEEQRIKKLNSDLDKRVAARTAQLLEALEDLGSFSYTVAHDLRSPLKNIAALSDHLHSTAVDKGNDADQVQCTERIYKGAKKMMDLVDDLLRFSQTSTRELERRDVMVRQLVEEVVSEQVDPMRKDQIQILLGPELQVQADAPMLKVVISNLLSNALKFTRDHIMPEITIGYRSQEDRDVLYVSDNGVGFDPQFKEQAFSAFKRLHNPEHFEGTGVGLAIVNRVVGKHGGEVWAESAVGKGTTIFVAFPRTAQGRVPISKVA
jgi:PAS domain S-box-containing protein